MAIPHEDENSNDQSPAFGPTWPNYPRPEQLVRVYGSADANGVYNGFVQQLANPPNSVTTRDREAVFVREPNSIPLAAGFYNATLKGAYLSPSGTTLPLFFTTCCPTGSSSATGH